MRPSTLRELADRAGAPVPPPLPSGVVGSWADFQTRYDTAWSVIRTSEDIVRIVTEAAADDAADGCGWLELSDSQLAALAEHSIRCSAAPPQLRDELLRGVRGWREATLSI